MRSGVAPGPCGMPSFGGDLMNRRVSDHLRPGLPPGALGALTAALLGLIGCTSPPQQQARLQSGEESEADRYGLKTVGDVTTVGNADADPAGRRRPGRRPRRHRRRSGPRQLPHHARRAADQGRRQGRQTGAGQSQSRPGGGDRPCYPPGAAKDDPIDVEVTLPPHAGKATSLRGGYLRECVLSDYDYTKHLSPNYKGSNVPLPGLPCAARCEGPVLVGMGDGDEADRVKHGRIWSGGRCLRPNPLLLLLNPEYQQARIAKLGGHAHQRRLPRRARRLAGGRHGRRQQQPRRRAARAAGLQAQPAALPARRPAGSAARLRPTSRGKDADATAVPPAPGRGPARPGPDGDVGPAPGGAGPGQHPGA